MGQQPVAAEDSDISTLFGLLPKSGRIEKLISVYLAGQIVYKAGKKQWDRWQENHKFVVSIPGDDDLYPLIHDWIVEQVPDNDRHALIARVNKRGNKSSDEAPVEVSYSGSQKTEAPKLRLMYDSTQTQVLMVNGSSIQISLIRPDWAGKIDLSRNSYLSEMAQREERITFTARSAYDQDKVIEFLKERATYLVAERKPHLYISTRWGGWNRRNDLPERSLDSVILKKGQKESLVIDFDRFFESEKMYAELGVPWHRGYLFFGPPGTGKTSLARALASHFKLDTYYIPLRDLDSDSNLIEAISNVPARSLLLLEDIDTIQSARSEDDEESAGKESPGVSAGGLLNALDGIITPHGLITIMTTNRIDRLDERLIRAGRADIHEKFEALTFDQLRDMMQQFVGVDITGRFTNCRSIASISASDIIGVVKSNLGNTTRIISEINKLVSS